MPEGQKPLPQPDEQTQFYWDAARRHELHILRCQDCQTYIHYPKPICWNCHSDNLKPERVSGRGTVYTYSVVRQNPMPPFRERVPYAVGIVELEEGPRMMSALVEARPEDIRIGLPVEVVFEREGGDDGMVVPRFRPAR